MATDPRFTGRGCTAPLLIQTALRLPPWLVQALAERSKQRKTSLEDEIVSALAEQLRTEKKE